MTDTLRHKTGTTRQYVGRGVATEPGDEVTPDDDTHVKALLDTGHFERVGSDERAEPEQPTCAEGDCSRTVDEEGERCWQHQPDDDTSDAEE